MSHNLLINSRRLVFASSIIFIMIACNYSEGKPIKILPGQKQLVFDKLTGTWQNENGKSFETWTKKPDGTYQSVAFSVKGNDTSWNENARIFPANGKWVFENTVRGQNKGKPVRFVSSLLNDNSVQFSNRAHDFPTDINYTVIDANTLHAFIVGPDKKGGRDTIHFNYTRFK